MGKVQRQVRGHQPNVKTQSKRDPGPPVVDEAAFQRLLSAAYVMQEHNNRLRKAPQPAAQGASSVPVKSVAAVPVPPPPVQPIPFLTEQHASANIACQECGSSLVANEFFCENCGAPAARSEKATQKNWASLWEMHHATEPETEAAAEISKLPLATTIHPEDKTEEEIDLFPAELEEIVGKFSALEIEEEPEHETAEPEHANQGLALVTAQPAATEASLTGQAASTWASAAKARAWLDSIKAQQPAKDWFQEEWNLHRGIIAIALASAVLLVVIFQWATQPVPSSGQVRELSGFEQVLVSLGLAEAPAPTALPSPGNPNTKVWVDVHTALYYCPGADIYGKTTNGKFTTQLDAQRDHFQPSTLKACD